MDTGRHILKLTIRNCRISISYYFFAAAAAAAIFDRSGIFLCGLTAAALHESGHLAAIMLSRFARVKEVSLGPLGIRISAAGNTCTPSVILSGVAANMIFAALSALWWYFILKSDIALQFCAANICLAACNIMPVEPLDGGVFLRFALERYLPPRTADRAVFAVSLCFLIILTAAAFYVLLRSKGNFSLLMLCLWLLAGILRRYLL